MPSDPSPRTVVADGIGIHFLHGGSDTVVVWGEIAQICALRDFDSDGRAFTEVSVDHFSGVDFRFKSIDVGYDQTTAEMENHLIGFQRLVLNDVRTFEEEGDLIPPVWIRNNAIQPLRFAPLNTDTRAPTSEECAQMQAAHEASIATCERILRRSLTVEELACVVTKFENCQIMGSINAPLCHLLLEHNK